MVKHCCVVVCVSVFRIREQYKPDGLRMMNTFTKSELFSQYTVDNINGFLFLFFNFMDIYSGKY